jgi:hypothetical protein
MRILTIMPFAPPLLYMFLSLPLSQIHFGQEVFEVAVQGWALVTLSQTSLLETHVLLLAAVICVNCLISPALSLAAVTLGGNDVAGRRKRLTWRAAAFAADLFFDYMYEEEN